MKALFVAALTLLLFSAPSYATEWWALAKNVSQSAYDLGAFTNCTVALTTPADLYESWSDVGYAPTIEDDGSLVRIVRHEAGRVLFMTFFRSRKACEKEAQANKGEKDDLAKYR